MKNIIGINPAGGYIYEENAYMPDIVLADVRANVIALLKSIDEYHETFTTAELESFSRQKLDASVKMMKLKNKINEYFS